MADAFEVRLTGWEPLIKRLGEIQGKARGLPLRRAVGKGANVIKREAKKNALLIDDKTTGRTIADNIGQRLRTRYNKQTGNVMVSVGVLSEPGPVPDGNPDTGPRGNTPHWHLVELGTALTPAFPFLRLALAQNVDAAIGAMQKEFSKQLDKAGV